MKIPAERKKKNCRSGIEPRSAILQLSCTNQSTCEEFSFVIYQLTTNREIYTLINHHWYGGTTNFCDLSNQYYKQYIILENSVYSSTRNYIYSSTSCRIIKFCISNVPNNTWSLKDHNTWIQGLNRDVTHDEVRHSRQVGMLGNWNSSAWDSAISGRRQWLGESADSTGNT